MLGVLLFPNLAQGRPYAVYSCRLPDGRSISTAGWSVVNRVGVAQAGDTCRSGGSMYIRFGSGIGAWRPQAWWVFQAPPDTHILAYALYRHVRVHLQPPASSVYRVFHGSVDAFGKDTCSPFYCKPGNPADPMSSANVVGDAPSPGQGVVRRLILELACWRTDDVGGCPGYSIPGLYVYSSVIVLSDDIPPAITSVSGTSERQPVGGRAALELGAVDRGSGVRSVSLDVDGRRVLTEDFDTNGGRCKAPFTSPQPCVLGGRKRLAWDTTRFADGFHRVSVILRDAAGNPSQSVTFPALVDNGGNQCVYGTGPKLRVGLGRRLRKRVSPWAGRRVVLRGRLRASTGVPITQGLVRLFVRIRGEDRYFLWTMLRTSGTGRFKMSLPPGPSRKLRVSYCAPGGGIHRDLKLAVRAWAKLRASRRRVRNGRSVLFSGRLLSRPIPRGGKLVELQAFFRRRWRTFETVTADPRGRFRVRYQFGATVGRVRYRFRARIPTESGYPFERGASAPIAVTVVGP